MSSQKSDIIRKRENSLLYGCVTKEDVIKSDGSGEDGLCGVQWNTLC